jgi:hypothetical protein
MKRGFNPDPDPEPEPEPESNSSLHKTTKKSLLSINPVSNASGTSRFQDVIVEDPPRSTNFFLKGCVYTGTLNYTDNKKLITNMKLAGFTRQLSQKDTTVYYNPNYILSET